MIWQMHRTIRKRYTAEDIEFLGRGVAQRIDDFFTVTMNKNYIPPEISSPFIKDNPKDYSGPWRNRTLPDRQAGSNLLIKSNIFPALQISTHCCILLQIVAAKNLLESPVFANDYTLLHISTVVF